MIVPYLIYFTNIIISFTYQSIALSIKEAGTYVPASYQADILLLFFFKQLFEKLGKGSEFDKAEYYGSEYDQTYEVV